MFARALWMLLIVCVGITTAQASPDIKHWQTANGVRVYFVAAPQLPMLDVRMIFNAGAARDGDRPGTALLTNAMLDEGAAGMSTNQIASAFEDVGADFDSSSHRDMAVLSLRTLTEKKAMKPAIATFTKVLTEPDFPADSFARLRKQVLTGLQAEKQSPGAIAMRAFFKNLYGDHPYANMPNGNEESINKITIDDLKQFYHKYYVAHNAVMVLVGALTETQAKKLANQISSALPAGHQAPKLPDVPPLKKAETIKVAYPSSQTHILMGQPGIKRGDPDYFPLYVGNHILGGSGLVSLLSKEVREKRGLTYGVYSYFLPMHQLGPYQFSLQTRNAKAGEALKVMKDTLDNFIKNGPTQAQLKAAKENITGGFALRVDSNSKIASYLGMIGFYNLPLNYLNTFVKKVNSVTVKQIHDAFIRRVHPDKMITVLVGGAEK